MNTRASRIHKEIVIAAGRRYRCHFERQPGGGYLVTSPQCLPLLVYGDTLELARSEAQQGIETWIEYADCRDLS